MSEEVVACGVPRSGSTLIWQILLRSLKGRRVIKAHPASWEPRDVGLIVGSIRHPYDTAASCFRTRIVGDKGDGSQETVTGTMAGLKAELRMMRSNFDALKVLMERYPDKVVVLRYEDFWQNFDVVYNVLIQKLGVSVPAGLRQRISLNCSFKANQRRSFSDIRGTEEFKTTRIGPSHTAIGVPGSWKTIIPFWGYDTLFRFCDPLCEEWGYESQH